MIMIEMMVGTMKDSAKQHVLHTGFQRWDCHKFKKIYSINMEKNGPVTPTGAAFPMRSYCLDKQQIRTRLRWETSSDYIALVEARGVEPLSESTSTGTSPSADGRLHSLTQPQAVKLLSLVES